MKLTTEQLKQELEKVNSIRELAKKLSLNYVALCRRCKRLNLNVQNKRKLNFDDIKNKYLSGISVHDIGKRYSVSGKTIWKLLKNNGIVMRKSGKIIKLNDSFFESIDTEEKAYWLGVICSDGCISFGEGQKAISIGVQANDVEWISDFKKAIGSGVNISYSDNKWRGAVHLHITSKKMHGDLCNLGIVSRKSKVLICPNIESNLKRHFWRGVLDGDGSIVSSKTKYVCTGTSASENFIIAELAYVKSLGLDAKISKNGSCYRVRLYGDSAKKYLALLYKGSVVSLRRKYLKAMQYIGEDVVLREGLVKVNMDIARVFIKKHHYLGTLKPSTTFGWYVKDELKGVLAIGSCSSPSTAKTIFGGENIAHVRELHRFCLSESIPNMASQFLAKAIKQYKIDNPDVWGIVSYSDRSQGHEGTIYKAVGAIELPSSLNRQLMVVLPNGKKLTGRQEVIIKGIEAAGVSPDNCELQISEGKNKFVILLGDKEEKMRLKAYLTTNIAQ